MGFIRFQDIHSVPLAVPHPEKYVLSPDEVAQWQSAQDMLRAARKEAEKIRADAMEAFEAEKRRGYAEGQAQARLDEAERLLDNASRAVEYFAAIENKIVKLVMQAVRRIMADFDDNTRVMAVVQSGLSVMRNQKQLTLRLPPEHVDAVKSRAHDLLQNFPGVGMLDIVGDPRLKDSAAILESDMGVVEASIELQLQAIEKSFSKMLGSRI
jgi:type III secretion protein L